MKQRYEFVPLLVMVMLSVACYAKSGMEAPAANLFEYSDSSGADYARLEQIAATQAESEESSLAVDETEAPLQETSQRKLVKRANLRIRVEDLAAADVSLSVLMEQHGAYASSREIDENSRSYVIRIPNVAYDEFLAAINGMGRILRRRESAEDVTIRYYDLEGRLATKKKLLETYQDYLRKAKNIEEILSVEERIAELQDDIDGTGKELRRLADLVDLATVTLDILGPVASAPYRGSTLGDRIKELFGGFGGFVSTALIVLVGIVIYGVPVILLLALLFWILFGKIGLMKKLWRIAAGKKGEKAVQ